SNSVFTRANLRGSHPSEPIPDKPRIGFDRLNGSCSGVSFKPLSLRRKSVSRLKNRSDLFVAMTTRCFPGVDNGSEQWAQDRDSKSDQEKSFNTQSRTLTHESHQNGDDKGKGQQQPY